ncbi:MAG: 50S ribosomal protein L9 [Candidatus Paceibacterota bacterium]|jgi:large subunit ribosomal protein L9
MQVILLKDVKGIGKKGEVRNVNDGHARNFLLPKQLAVIATEKSVAHIERTNNEQLEAEKERVKKLKARAQELTKIKLHFVLKAGEKGEIFGSVSARDIEKEMHRFETNGKALLEHPLKALGIFPVSIDIGEGICTTITVEIKPEK